MKRWILCFLILVLLCTMPVSALPEEAFCATEEEYLAALIAAKQSAEPRSFVSFEMRVSEELLDALYADNCALQHQLVAERRLVLLQIFQRPGHGSLILLAPVAQLPGG